jgi:hypothetical protein
VCTIFFIIRFLFHDDSPLPFFILQYFSLKFKSFSKKEPMNSPQKGYGEACGKTHAKGKDDLSPKIVLDTKPRAFQASQGLYMNTKSGPTASGGAKGESKGDRQRSETPCA